MDDLNRMAPDIARKPAGLPEGAKTVKPSDIEYRTMNPRLPLDVSHEFAEVAHTGKVQIEAGGVQPQANVSHLPFRAADFETGNHCQYFDLRGLRQRHIYYQFMRLYEA